MEGNTAVKPEKPLYIAQECPVCNGFGSLKYGTKLCQACEGKGYILIPNYKVEGRTEGYGNNTKD